MEKGHSYINDIPAGFCFLLVFVLLLFLGLCRILWQDSQTPYAIVMFFTGIIVWTLRLKAFLKQPSGIVPIFAVPASLFLPVPLLIVGYKTYENNENENGRIYFISSCLVFDFMFFV